EPDHRDHGPGRQHRPPHAAVRRVGEQVAGPRPQRHPVLGRGGEGHHHLRADRDRMRRQITSLRELDELSGDRPEASPSTSDLQTEFEFELPRGYLHTDGTLHRTGRMRLATARDELRPQIDIRVKENPAYLSVVLLAQVITRLGSISDIHPGLVEQMYATDLA